MTTSLSKTETSKEESVSLERVPCIHHLLSFQKNNVNVRASIDSGSEVNAMTLAYASKLGLKVYHIDAGAQKIDGSILKIFGIVLAKFQVEDKLEKARFF